MYMWICRHQLMQFCEFDKVCFVKFPDTKLFKFRHQLDSIQFGEFFYLNCTDGFYRADFLQDFFAILIHGVLVPARTPETHNHIMLRLGHGTNSFQQLTEVGTNISSKQQCPTVVIIIKLSLMSAFILLFNLFSYCVPSDCLLVTCCFQTAFPTGYRLLAGWLPSACRLVTCCFQTAVPSVFQLVTCWFQTAFPSVFRLVTEHCVTCHLISLSAEYTEEFMFGTQGK